MNYDKYTITATKEFLEDVVASLNDPKRVYKNIQLHKNANGIYEKLTVDMEVDDSIPGRKILIKESIQMLLKPFTPIES